MSAQTDEIVEQDEPEGREPAEGMAALSAYTRGYVARVRGGELGSIPALVGLIVITVVFAVVHQGFLSAYNIEALVIQAAPIIVMAMGLVFVLLLGEIDLSAGTTAGPERPPQPNAEDHATRYHGVSGTNRPSRT